MISPSQRVHFLDFLHLRNTINKEYLDSSRLCCLDMRGQLGGGAEDSVGAVKLQLTDSQNILLIPHVELQSKLLEVLLHLNQSIGSNICNSKVKT